MPVIVAALVAAVVIAAVVSSSSSDLRKKITDPMNRAGGIRGAGGRVMPFVPATYSFPGGSIDAPGAPAAVLTAISNAAQTLVAPQSSFSVGIMPTGQTEQPPLDRSPNPIAAIPVTAPSPLAGPISWITQPDPTNVVAPNVPMLSPTAAAPQYYPPYAEPRDVPPWSPPTLIRDVSPGGGAIPAFFDPALGWIAPTYSGAPAEPAYNPLPYAPPAYVPLGGGGALDPGLYSAPNIGVSTPAPPGGGGGRLS